MMRPILALADALDWVNAQIGRRVMWLAAVLVLVQFLVVVLRYAYGSSFVWMQESVIYVHATLFMLTIAYAWLHDGHVRVDVLYSGWSARTKAAVDLACVMLAVLPFCALMLWAVWPDVAMAWRAREGSRFVGGIPFMYLFKTLLPVMAILLAVQAVAIALRCVAVIAGHAERVFPAKPGAAA